MPEPKNGTAYLSETWRLLADAYTEGAAKIRTRPCTRRLQRTADAMDASAARYRRFADAERRWTRTPKGGATS
jgi:hypothetical protein